MWGDEHPGAGSDNRLARFHVHGGPSRPAGASALRDVSGKTDASVPYASWPRHASRGLRASRSPFPRDRWVPSGMRDGRALRGPALVIEHARNAAVPPEAARLDGSDHSGAGRCTEPDLVHSSDRASRHRLTNAGGRRRRPRDHCRHTWRARFGDRTFNSTSPSP